MSVFTLKKRTQTFIANINNEVYYIKEGRARRAVFRNKGEYYGAKKPYPIDRPV